MATDIKLSISVPDGVEVLQTPSQLFLLNNHKTVVYVLLKGQCPKKGAYSAVLDGNLLGVPFQHRIDFSVTDEHLGSQFPSVVHLLMAKNLIQE